MSKYSLRSFWPWLLTKFWWLWAANALIALFVVFVFILGWHHETINAPNIPAWCAILVAVFAFVGGILYLHSKSYLNAATAAAALVPVPLALWLAGSILFGLLYLALSLIGQLLGHGRVN